MELTTHMNLLKPYKDNKVIILPNMIQLSFVQLKTLVPSPEEDVKSLNIYFSPI
jgi:hypothetical protein